MEVLGFDLGTLVLALGGLVGALLRSVVSKDQPLKSKQTLVDLVTGGLIGILAPAFDLFPAGWTILQKAAGLALVSYSTSDLVTNLVGRLNMVSPPMNRRVGDPDSRVP